jgi:2-methylisocitrate lyase-like PEP mutase family enzyme
MIIARTDAIAVTGFDDALRRAELAAKAGADMLFIEAPESEAQFEKIAASFDLPLLFNYAPGGQRTPLIPIEELRRLRYAVIILPIQSLLIATKAVQGFLARLRAGEDARTLSDEGLAWSAFNTLIGADEQMAISETYAS